MRLKILVMATVLCAVSGAFIFAAPTEYVAMKTGSKMAMDGILNEPAWQKAKPVGPFVFTWFKSGEKEQTEAKILWDDERIYFAFSCDDKHIWAEHYSPNEMVSRDDCCEAFICPVPEGKERMDYVNYEFNCIGTWFMGYHAKTRNINADRWYDFTGFEVGRIIDGTCNNDEDIDKGWVLEFSVPYTHFEGFGATFPPKDGQVIYVGLQRGGGKTNPQYSQWAPSQTERPNFHRPEDFGKVTFSTRILK